MGPTERPDLSGHRLHCTISSFGRKRKVDVGRSGRRIFAAVALGLYSPIAAATVLVDPEQEVAFGLRQLSEKDTESRYWGTVLLGRFPDLSERFLEPLRGALHDPEWPVRLGAVRTFEVLGTRAADNLSVGAIAGLLDDESPDVRVAAAFALAAIGVVVAGAESQLELQLQDRSALQRVASATALVVFGSHVAPKDRERIALATSAASLLGALVDRDRPPPPSQPWDEPATRWAARLASAAARLDPTTAFATLPRIVFRFELGSEAARAAAHGMAPHLKQFADDLRLRVQSGSPDSRREAILAAGLLQLSNAEMLAALADLLDDDVGVAIEAANALREIGSAARPAARDLERTLRGSTNRAVREAAASALIAIDWEGAGEIANELRESDPEFGEWMNLRVVLAAL